VKARTPAYGNHLTMRTVTWIDGRFDVLDQTAPLRLHTPWRQLTLTDRRSRC